MLNTLPNLLSGITVGLGAAVPIGPVNIEIMRRNLNQGLKAGISFALGACFGDLLYLITLLLGILHTFKHQRFFNTLSLLGSIVLFYFAYQCLSTRKTETTCPQPSSFPTSSILTYFFQGLLMALLNPYTLLFWASIGSQIIHLSTSLLSSHAITAGTGVFLGTLLWAVSFNLVVAKLNVLMRPSTVHYLNAIGGVILFAFALFCLGSGLNVMLSH